MMLDKKFGQSGARVVIEERMTGPELTVLCFTDGKTIVQMPSSRDHKRVYDDDKGPNTGGMGAFCPVADYTPELAERCLREIFVPTIEAMNAEGRKFKGVIYFGLMLTPDGPKVVEYNARFGDPETQPVLALLETDLLDVFEAVTDERLSDIDVKWKKSCACCVVIASGGYPVAYKSGYEIHGLDEAGKIATVFHAGTKAENGKFYTNGGRVLGVTAVADSMEKAVRTAYAAADKISFENMHMRRDIAKSAFTVR
jgi:phosphoribosylamine--glycine ligase